MPTTADCRRHSATLGHSPPLSLPPKASSWAQPPVPLLPHVPDRRHAGTVLPLPGPLRRPCLPSSSTHQQQGKKQMTAAATGPAGCQVLTVLEVNSGGLSFTSVTMMMAVAVFERP